MAGNAVSVMEKEKLGRELAICSNDMINAKSAKILWKSTYDLFYFYFSYLMSTLELH